jgi:hypothetical protein
MKKALSSRKKYEVIAFVECDRNMQGGTSIKVGGEYSRAEAMKRAELCTHRNGYAEKVMPWEEVQDATVDYTYFQTVFQNSDEGFCGFRVSPITGYTERPITMLCLPTNELTINGNTISFWIGDAGKGIPVKDASGRTFYIHDIRPHYSNGRHKMVATYTCDLYYSEKGCVPRYAGLLYAPIELCSMDNELFNSEDTERAIADFEASLQRNGTTLSMIESRICDDNAIMDAIEAIIADDLEARRVVQ